jgi:hypothetical protein
VYQAHVLHFVPTETVPAFLPSLASFRLLEPDLNVAFANIHWQRAIEKSVDALGASRDVADVLVSATDFLAL